MVEKQVDHLVRLVDDLLEVSRMTSGKIELKKKQCDLNVILRHAVDTSQPFIQSGGHRLTLELPSSPLTLDADPVRLAQVFANLLNNAAKYTENRGHIWLKAERSGEQVIVSVRDNGIGILPEMLPRVFDLFAQSDDARCRAQGGLGLGLALVRSLVQMHGGQVEVRSEGCNRGSEFIVRLPIGAAVSSEGERKRGEAAAPHPSHRVLVVDDQHAVADSFAMLLERLGVSVRVAYEGGAALSAISTFKPHFAFVDIGMPGMDGYETARRIRMLAEGKDLFLAALSGWGQEDDRRRSMEAGFDHHFVKPIKIDVLEDLLASTQSRRPPRPALS
jgi:CheY-like chemotaxis protein/two-component sensor histidine kinase